MSVAWLGITAARDDLLDAGPDVVLLSPSTGDIQAVNGDIFPAGTFAPDDLKAFSSAAIAAFAAS